MNNILIEEKKFSLNSENNKKYELILIKYIIFII